MAIGDILDEKVGDLECPGRRITYPLSDEMKASCKLKYDFHILKPGNIWVYVDSCNSKGTKRWDGHKKATKDGGGDWRIVENATSKIVDEG